MKTLTRLFAVVVISTAALTSCTSTKPDASLQTQAAIVAAQEAVTLAADTGALDQAQSKAIAFGLGLFNGGEINASNASGILETAQAALALAGKDLPKEQAAAIRIGLRLVELLVTRRTGNA